MNKLALIGLVALSTLAFGCASTQCRDGDTCATGKVCAVNCENAGHCEGDCKGKCEGNCESKCAGKCEGNCAGKCEGNCAGHQAQHDGDKKVCDPNCTKPCCAS